MKLKIIKFKKRYYIHRKCLWWWVNAESWIQEMYRVHNAWDNNIACSYNTLAEANKFLTQAVKYSITKKENEICEIIKEIDTEDPGDQFMATI